MAWWTFTSGRIGRRAGAGEGAGAGAAESGPAPGAILSESCTFHSPAVVMDLASPQRLEGRFAILRDREVVIDIVSADGVSEGAGTCLQPLSACCVSFPHRGRAMAFLAQVRRIEEGATPERPRQLTLRLPEQILSADLRSADRVHNFRGSGLEMTLCDREGGTWHPHVANLSTSGCLAEFSESELAALPDWPLAADVGVELAMDGRRVSLSGVIRRKEGARWALTFREALRSGDLDPPEALLAIVRGLERHWSQRETRPPPAAPLAPTP